MNNAYFGPNYNGALPVSPINTAWIVKDYYDSIAGYVRYFHEAANNAQNSNDAIAVKAIADIFNETFVFPFSTKYQVLEDI